MLMVWASAVTTCCRCSCKHNKGQPCHTVFNPDQMVELRLNMAGFSASKYQL